MEIQERLRNLQQELAYIESRRESLQNVDFFDKYIEFISNQIAELSSNGFHNTQIRGDIGPGSVIGSGSVTAGVIVDGNVSISLGSKDENFSALEEDYLRILIVTNARLFLGALDPSEVEHSRPNLDLARIFVPLNVTEAVPMEGEAGEMGETRALSVVEAISQYTHLTLLGDPGSGKSTALKYMTWCLATMRLDERVTGRKADKDFWANKLPGWQAGPLLPIPITLTDLAQWITTVSPTNTDHISNYIDYVLAKLGVHHFSKYILSLIRAGEAIVFFDGLDEVTDLEMRRKVLKAIKHFVDLYFDTRIIITCRVLSYTNSKLQLKDFTTQTLAGLTTEQAQHFIMSWYTQLVEKKLLQKDLALYRARNLERIVVERLSEFSSNPLLLTVMVIVHASKGDLPREKARLYNQCCDILLWHWQQAKFDVGGEVQQGIGDQLGARNVELMSALMDLAYQNHAHQDKQRETLDITEFEVLSIFRRYFGGDLDSPFAQAEALKKAKLFLEYIQDRAGLLVAKGNSAYLGEAVYAFVHRTFQEFLAGCYLTTQRDLQRLIFSLVQSEDSDKWYEVTLLAIGHLVFNNARIPEAIDIAKFLIVTSSETKEQERRAIWWAAEFLALVGKEATERDFIGKQLLPDVRNRLVELLTSGQFSPRQREAAGEALAKIGDPRESVTNPQPTFVSIPNGSFIMGAYKPETLASNVEQPACNPYLEPFEISLHPITNIQFRAFIDDGGYTANHCNCWTDQGWKWRILQNWERPEFLDDPNWGVDNKPVVGVSWFEAVAYTNWLSKCFDMHYRLPTEAEWERAARGSDGSTYPWGEDWILEVANTRELGLRGPTSVGIFPLSNSQHGCTDMIGNVWEWCQSLYKIYPYILNDGREELNSEGPRVIRGGSYLNSSTLSRCTYRLWRFPIYRSRYIGFRVVQVRSLKDS